MKIITTLPGFAVHQVRRLFSGKPRRLLETGTEAPDFSIQDESGNVHTLRQYRGQRVVLWWFIRAQTPG